MSEVKEKYTLEEFVFRNIWEAQEFRIKKNKVLKEKAGIDPISLVNIYQKWKKDRDAERWEYALESYKYYLCFSGNDYDRKDEEYYLYYTCKGGGNCCFKITADILTGPNEILNPIKSKDKGIELSKLKNKDLKDALEVFCSVAYTVGNFCPVMRNPGGGNGTDTGWYKLSNYLNLDEPSDIEDVFCRNMPRKGVNNSQATRSPNDMFKMFHDKPARKEIIKRLMLQDYYKDPDLIELVITQTPIEIWNEGVDKYIDFLNEITKLIVKRGIRIYRQNDLRGIIIDKLAEKLIQKRKSELAAQ